MSVFASRLQHLAESQPYTHVHQNMKHVEVQVGLVQTLNHSRKQNRKPIKNQYTLVKDIYLRVHVYVYAGAFFQLAAYRLERFTAPPCRAPPCRGPNYVNHHLRLMENVYRAIWQSVRDRPYAATWAGPVYLTHLTEHIRRFAPAYISLADVRTQLDLGNLVTAPDFLAALRSVFTSALSYISSDTEGGNRTLAITCLHAVDDAVASQPKMLAELERAGSRFVRVRSSFVGWETAARSLERLLAVTISSNDTSLSMTRFIYPVEEYA